MLQTIFKPYTTLVQRVSTRYGQQAELKEQNQHLVATNEELKKDLADAQVQKMITEKKKEMYLLGHRLMPLACHDCLMSLRSHC